MIDDRIRRTCLIGYISMILLHLAAFYYMGIPSGLSGQIGILVAISSIVGYFFFFVYSPKNPGVKFVIIAILCAVSFNRAIDYLILMDMGSIPDDTVQQVLFVASGYTVAVSALLGMFWRWMSDTSSSTTS